MCVMSGAGGGQIYGGGRVLLQSREGVWGLALQPAVAQEFNYLFNPYMT